MSLIPTLENNARVAVVGASGGIGAAVVKLLEADHRVADVFAFARSPESIPSERAFTSSLDLHDESSVEAAVGAAAENGPLDLVFVATGVLHRQPDIAPEKCLRDLDPAVLAGVLAINTTGPAIVAKHFLPRMRRGSKTVFAALSARVGSIADNRLGGWASYRASKAALNMLLRTISIEHRRRYPASIIAALHPGTVDTGLSQPFTKRVPDGQLFTPAGSARHLLGVIDSLTADDSGGFFAWDRSAIEY